jgi:aspartyl-tRNA(Asn)/glutamyl-tRNA(Gln) amidotransferase subunit C
MSPSLLTIDEKLVREIAFLARLDLSETEVALFVDQFGDILDYFSILDEVDTDGVLPAYQAARTPSVLRPDEPETGFSVDDLLRNAPASAADSVVIPRVHFEQ